MLQPARTLAPGEIERAGLQGIAPATYRLNAKIELVTRRRVALTLVSETFADILRQVTRPLRCRAPVRKRTSAVDGRESVPPR